MSERCWRVTGQVPRGASCRSEVQERQEGRVNSTMKRTTAPQRQKSKIKYETSLGHGKLPRKEKGCYWGSGLFPKTWFANQSNQPNIPNFPPLWYSQERPLSLAACKSIRLHPLNSETNILWWQPAPIRPAINPLQHLPTLRSQILIADTFIQDFSLAGTGTRYLLSYTSKELNAFTT